MPLDPNIPLSGRPAQIADPFELQAQAKAHQMALGQMHRQGRIQEQTIAENERQAAAQQLAAQESRDVTGAAGSVDWEKALASLPAHLRPAATKARGEMDKYATERRNAAAKQRAAAARGIATFGYDPSVAQFAFQAIAEDDPQALEMWEQVKANPEHLKKVVDYFITQDPDYKPPTPVSVAPGAKLVNPQTGATVAQGDPREALPPQVGTFGDYLITYAKDVAKKPVQALSASDKEAAKKTWEALNDQPPQPIQRFQDRQVTNAHGETVIANYDSLTGKYFDANSGQQLTGIKPKPTAEMQNRQDALKGLVPMLKNLKGLSETIITRVGPGQRAEAAKRGLEAMAGNDPEFRVYQDFRAALGVMIAVATQGSRPSDADVFRAALPMVPNPYADTKESTEKKWKFIFDMFRNRLSKEMQQQLDLTAEPSTGGAAPIGAAPSYQDYLNRKGGAK